MSSPPLVLSDLQRWNEIKTSKLSDISQQTRVLVTTDHVFGTLRHQLEEDHWWPCLVNAWWKCQNEEHSKAKRSWGGCWCHLVTLMVPHVILATFHSLSVQARLSRLLLGSPRVLPAVSGDSRFLTRIWVLSQVAKLLWFVFSQRKLSNSIYEFHFWLQ